jgi:alkaline phosphatase D
MQAQAFVSRRAFLSRLTIAAAGTLAASAQMHRLLAQGAAPALITSEATRPAIPYGVASGDVTRHAAIIWSRTDRPGRLIVEYATTEAFTNLKRVVGPAALAASDFTARVDLTELPPGQELFHRVTFQALADGKSLSAPVIDRVRTAPAQRRDITFAWGEIPPAKAGGSLWNGAACGSMSRCAGCSRTFSSTMATASTRIIRL